ncbi:ATP-binding protein [Crateriforma spongiae]|uniref:ATP-binding protein n=1 Tax=Crateriforma spongiae TaxID=2724528 RepID=UPI0014458BB8|nr:ATP-binding protein [Crateriforma spongiae]
MLAQHERIERDLRGQTRVLKRLAEGASLDEILHTLVEVAEESRPEMIGSVLLLDSDGRLRNGASLRLPDEYIKAVDGVIPAADMGSCGTAAYLKRRVVVEDIATDPLWKMARNAALKASLRACWSEPIISTTGDVLGTFAMYYREPRKPSESDLDFVSSMGSLAALAIERVRHQNAVERERAVLTAIVNGIPDALVMTGLDRRITHFGGSAEKLFGYTADEVLGQTTELLYASSDDYKRMGDEHFNTISMTTTDATELIWRRKSGETFPGEIVGAVIRDEQGSPFAFLGLIRDITERKIAEERLAESQLKLVQSERLAAMGQMVSAIAHESRNALQRIQVGIDVLGYEIKSGTEAGDDLERISRAKDDLLKLHDGLRNFAGQIRLQRSTANLADAWRLAWGNLNVLRQGRDATLVENADGVDLECPHDAFRIEQVFRNLFENSLAATEDPVTIDITATKQIVDGRDAIVVTVRDNGPGLTAEQREKVFDAFFSTKPKGTGLGMAIALRFMQAHGGTIQIGQSRCDGAEFLLTFPKPADENAPANRNRR